MKSRLAPFVLASVFVPAVAAAKSPSIDAMLSCKPVMEGISIDTPGPERRAELRSRTIEREKVSGWQLSTEDGIVLRRFLDTNNDKKVDRWIYFRDGRQVYRDVDTDHDGIADIAIRMFQLKKGEDGKLVVQSDDAPRNNQTRGEEPSAGPGPQVELTPPGG